MRTWRVMVAAVAMLGLSMVPPAMTVAAPGPVWGATTDFDGDYFLDPGDSTKTKADSVSASDVASFSRTLNPAKITTRFGSADAKVTLEGSVGAFPDNVTAVHAVGAVSGTAHRTTAHASASPTAASFDVPVAGGDVAFEVGFHITGSVPATITVIGSASNNDGDDCAEVDASLDVTAQGQPMALDRVVAAAGGDCAEHAQGGIHFQGVLSGEGSLEVEADGSVDAQKPGTTKSFASTFNVSVTFPAGACTVTGSDADETLDGTAGADVICGMGGADTLNGLEGDDLIIGGADVDTIDGGPGDDTIQGLADDDVIQGGTGNDRVDAAAGDDTISDAGGPNALLAGGTGDDSICGSNQRDIVHGDAGSDNIVGFGGSDSIDAGSGNDNVFGDGSVTDALTVGCVAPAGPAESSLNDLIGGGTGDDHLVGGAGDDVLKGEPGSDKLLGGSGHDRLEGGGRKDVLNGGSGPDLLKACDNVKDTVTGGSGHDAGRIDVGKDTVHGVETKTGC